MSDYDSKLEMALRDTQFVNWYQAKQGMIIFNPQIDFESDLDWWCCSAIDWHLKSHLYAREDARTGLREELSPEDLASHFKMREFQRAKLHKFYDKYLIECLEFGI